MEIVILGSGTSVPTVGRRPPAFLARQGADALLVDCGAGSSSTLADVGVSLDQLSGVALTHLHPDHTAELLPILFALHNPLGPSLENTLPIWGPPGTADHLAALKRVYGRWIEPRGGAIEVDELRAGCRRTVGDHLEIEAFEVTHAGRAALAYRLFGDRVVCFSGDTEPCAAIVEAARGADLFLCECGAVEGEETPHLSPTDAARIAEAAGCARLVLTHLYPHVLASDPLPRARERFSGSVRLGEDGMRFQHAEGAL